MRMNVGNYEGQKEAWKENTKHNKNLNSFVMYCSSSNEQWHNLRRHTIDQFMSQLMCQIYLWWSFN